MVDPTSSSQQPVYIDPETLKELNEDIRKYRESIPPGFHDFLDEIQANPDKYPVENGKTIINEADIPPNLVDFIKSGNSRMKNWVIVSSPSSNSPMEKPFGIQ